MIEVSLRMKKDDSCPEDLVKSINTCLQQTLSYSHNRLNQMDQLKKLRILTAVIQKNMETVRQFELYCWLTEGGTNFYNICIIYYSKSQKALKGWLYFRLEVKTKITSLQENCIYAIGPQMRSLKDQQVRELQLPSYLTEKLIEYKRKDQQYYHCENQLKIYPHHTHMEKPTRINNQGDMCGDIIDIIWNKLKTFFSIVLNIFTEM